MHNSIQLSHGKSVFADGPALLIAEVSANHDHDLDQALALVDIAADAGWHCLKLQTYTADSLSVPSDHPSTKIDQIWGAENLYELYQNAAMPMEFHKPLFNRAHERGLVPFTSVYDPMDLNFTEDLGCELYKIASFEMTYDDLLLELAQTKKPLILSTGMANLAEVDHAIEVLSRFNHGPLVLLHCCSSYPAPLEKINLRAMEVLKNRYNLPVGFSDHTIGSTASVTAAAMGAVAIEKHFTNDPKRSGPDHRFSATPEIMAEIAAGASETYLVRGKANKTTADVESTNKLVGRRSAFAVKDLVAGTLLSPNDFRFVRPAAGIPANDPAALQGAILKHPVLKGHPIKYEDIKK